MSRGALLTRIEVRALVLVEPGIGDLLRPQGRARTRGRTRADLESNQIGNDGARALANSGHLGSLRSLDLSSNRIDEQSALRESPRLSGATVVEGRQHVYEAG